MLQVYQYSSLTCWFIKKMKIKSQNCFLLNALSFASDRQNVSLHFMLGLTLTTLTEDIFINFSQNYYNFYQTKKLFLHSNQNKWMLETIYRMWLYVFIFALSFSLNCNVKNHFFIILWNKWKIVGSTLNKSRIYFQFIMGKIISGFKTQKHLYVSF